MTKLKTLFLRFLSVNCYVVSDETTKRALIVDPGSGPDFILNTIKKMEVKPEGILLTHAHVDHISAVPEIAEAYNIPVWLHKDDIPLYFAKENALQPWMGAVPNLPQPVEECPTAGLDFSIIHTPGHTKGSCCFYFPRDRFILTGDTLFNGTYGRTDFPGGSYEEIMDSIKNKLLKLPEDVIVHPGHDQETTIGEELENPMFA